MPMTNDETILVSLGICTDEAVISIVRRLQRQTTEEHAYETMGVEWRSVDQLLTLLNYLCALIGASADARIFDALQRNNALLYQTLRSQRRELVPVS